ncbi:class I tRNA ligase family protein [Petropleomorpha daqingensis]|uniref:Cysteinyl-tRNA synthetase n=1 Tax=Petropleomorpha daqingensis TaxID=2026353 RepID=A0A853CNQ8_9ACTN|nr:class I tRNA ligase family protein [Petropleomorpha daqingensis]NYJ08439.1 cysteinyl-tRNA synthetase [Petropleomorpha daqingensis]
MAARLVPTSGVLGFAGRITAPEDNGTVRSSGLRLAGAPLPVVGTVRIYTCGITPYDVTHLGHAATFVWSDVLGGVLGAIGVDVVTSRNVTDVDDVLTHAAAVRGRYYDEFALSQEFLFERDMQALRVHRPTHAPRARHHVPHVQHLAVALLAAGAAYERDGAVYFRGAGIAERAGLDRDRALELAAAFGDDPTDPRKDDPFDVPVWRPSGEADPAWPSPWGWGRPGWHAECAAMAAATLGLTVDVLVGGEDLTFPHHAYQAAMVEAAVGVTPFARRQVHVGAVRKDGTKMAKSTGNLTLVADLLESYTPSAVRLMLLDRPYGSAWDFDPALLDGAAARVERLYAAAGRVGGDTGHDAVLTALLDDLDVPHALAVAEEEGGAAARFLLRVLALD